MGIIHTWEDSKLYLRLCSVWEKVTEWKKKRKAKNQFYVFGYGEKVKKKKWERITNIYIPYLFPRKLEGFHSLSLSFSQNFHLSFLCNFLINRTSKRSSFPFHSLSFSISLSFPPIFYKQTQPKYQQVLKRCRKKKRHVMFKIV